MQAVSSSANIQAHRPSKHAAGETGAKEASAEVMDFCRLMTQLKWVSMVYCLYNSHVKGLAQKADSLHYTLQTFSKGRLCSKELEIQVNKRKTRS